MKPATPMATGATGCHGKVGDHGTDAKTFGADEYEKYSNE